MKKTLLGIAGALLLLVAAYFLRDYYRNYKQLVPPPVSFTDIAEGKLTRKTPPKSPVVKTPVVAPVIPAEFNLSMPFYTQAPYGDWGYPWQEACEEASMLLVANEYLKKHWTLGQFNQQILDMVAWENKNLGYYRDTTMAENARILEEDLGLKTITHENPTLDDIKTILLKGHFIVMPLDGKLIDNPFFSNGGPVYHVLVAKGYTKDNGIISNDVGTKHGEDYIYSWDVLNNALHDFAVPMSTGKRLILEVLPPS